MDQKTQLRGMVGNELRLMKAKVKKHYEVQLRAHNNTTEGYLCLWEKSCGKRIKGSGSFRKHLNSHVQQFSVFWSQLVEEHDEWTSLAGFVAELVNQNGNPQQDTKDSK